MRELARLECEQPSRPVGAAIWLVVALSVAYHASSLAQGRPGPTHGTLVVERVVYASPGVTGVVGAVVRPDGTAFLVESTGAIVEVSRNGERRRIAQLDSSAVAVAAPLPMTASASDVIVYDARESVVLRIAIGDGRIARTPLAGIVETAHGLGAIGDRLLLAGYSPHAPSFAVHEFELPDLRYVRSFGAARSFRDSTDRVALTGGTLNVMPDGTVLFAELNPPRVEVLSRNGEHLLSCTPREPFDIAESVAVNIVHLRTSRADSTGAILASADSTVARGLTNAFPASRGAAQLGNGLLVLAAFDIRSRALRLTVFDQRCVSLREATLAADLWIVGVDSSSRLYALRTYGDQDLVAYRVAP